MIAYGRAYTQLIVHYAIFDHGVYPEIERTCKEARRRQRENGAFGPSPELGTCHNDRLSIRGNGARATLGTLMSVW